MGSGDTGNREQILQRVRAAVRKPAAKRFGPTGPIFTPVTNLLERFQAECAANYVECLVTADAAGTLNEVLASLPPGEAFVQDAPELRDLVSRAGVDRPGRWSSAGAVPEASQATVTLCHALVALTGSLLVSSGNGGRGASVVAPCHIVVAHQDQFVPDLDAALARARDIAFEHSYVGLITGSSRTADIEKKLIIGAHGPRRLVVIIQTS